MTSWTAEIEWNEDLRGRQGIDRFMAILEQNLGSLRAEFVTGRVIATVTQAATTLPQAMWVALDRAEAAAGHTVSLRRIVATEVYNQTVKSPRPRRRTRSRKSTIFSRHQPA